MNGYDWDFGFGFGQRHSAHRGAAGYGGEFQRGYDRPFGGRRGGFAQGGGGGRGFGGGYGSQQAGRLGGDIERSVYGEDYPTFGGFPGGRREGMYYGGPGQGRGGDYRQQSGMGLAGGVGGGGGYDRGWESGRGGYDAGFAQAPFLPETAYHRHPELDRPQRGRGDRWPAQGHDEYHHVQRSDDEIERAVRENLYEDSWVDADRIDVSVENGVVTLQGEVGDYLEARYAWDDAWEAQGVRGVINQITVRADLPADEHAVIPQTSGGRSGG
ncbi:MAG TPA: BON domain-containing protein, partial [Longimicrobiaceae bacterium]|nr:BON domain-containing protein [Longimicrobiaceae bacterium]